MKIHTHNLNPPLYTVDHRQVFGVIPKETQPSMFDILTWNPHRTSPPTDQTRIRVSSPLTHHINHTLQAHNGALEKKEVNVSTSKQPLRNQTTGNPEIHRVNYYKPEKTRIERPITAQLYTYEEVVPVVKTQKPKGKEEAAANKVRPHSAYINRNRVPKYTAEKVINKPPFAAYGRGNTNTQFDYMKSHNVLPHSGTNHPRTNETYDSALLVKNKHQYPSIYDIEDVTSSQKIMHFQLPEQSHARTSIVVSHPKPDEYPNNHKQPNRNKHKNKKNKKMNNLSEESFKVDVESPAKKDKREPALKFMNRRGDFMQEVREEESKKNRLALKPTECYPGEYNVKSYDLGRSHSSHAQAAGKKTKAHEDIRDLMLLPPYC